MKLNLRKTEAIRLRKKGYSIKKIGKRLGIAYSTLSGWLRNVELTKKQKEKLFRDWESALVKARVKATEWHNLQKRKRLETAAEEAQKVLGNINLKDSNVIELALAMLYLGEGFKKTAVTGMGNTDPLILKTFVALLRKYYGARDDQFQCQLHLRADQNASELKKHWSSQLKLPLSRFTFVYFDKRTEGSKTYADYKGVCIVRHRHVAIQRKLVNLGRGFCEKVIDTRP